MNTEAKEAQPESATTGCSVAGGDTNTNQTGRSVGREPCILEVVDYIDVLCSEISSRYRDGDGYFRTDFRDGAVYIKQKVADFIEERRRSTGCAEPPAD